MRKQIWDNIALENIIFDIIFIIITLQIRILSPLVGDHLLVFFCLAPVLHLLAFRSAVLSGFNLDKGSESKQEKEGCFAKFNRIFLFTTFVFIIPLSLTWLLIPGMTLEIDSEIISGILALTVTVCFFIQLIIMKYYTKPEKINMILQKKSLLKRIVHTAVIYFYVQYIEIVVAGSLILLDPVMKNRAIFVFIIILFPFRTLLLFKQPMTKTETVTAVGLFIFLICHFSCLL